MSGDSRNSRCGTNFGWFGRVLGIPCHAPTTANTRKDAPATVTPNGFARRFTTRCGFGCAPIPVLRRTKIGVKANSLIVSHQVFGVF